VVESVTRSGKREKKTQRALCVGGTRWGWMGRGARVEWEVSKACKMCDMWAVDNEGGSGQAKKPNDHFQRQRVSM